MLIPPQAQTPAPPAPTAPVVIVPGATSNVLSVDELHQQIQVLTGQMAGLSAERSGLMAQLRSGPVADRAGTVAELDRVNHQLALSTGQLANVRAQLEIRQTMQGTQAPRADVSPRVDPDLMAGLAFAFIFAVMMPIAIAYARRVWRGNPKAEPPRLDELSGARLERLEQAVDSIAIEIERVSEGQRFVTRVLSERVPEGKAAASLGASVLDGQDSPLRALGAGPIEPIRMAERQAVRQSITPH
ncbi:MAG: hypothetical protein ABI205_10645 [Gemmatimonadaceae bacterium]